MRTNIEINEELMAEIMKKTSIKTKKEIVHKALEEYLRKLKLRDLANMAGKVEWEGDLEAMRRDQWGS